MRHRFSAISSLFATAAMIGVALGPVRASEFNDTQKQEIETIISDYLLENPDLIRQVFTILSQQEAEKQQQAEQQRAEKAKQAVVQYQDEIFNAKDQIVLGNPQGRYHFGRVHGLQLWLLQTGLQQYA